LRVAGQPIDTWTVQRTDFEDHALRLPATVANGPSRVEISSESGTFSAAHYWSYGSAQ